MEKAKNVIDFYVLCNSLKNVVRSGWKIWGVSKERVESVAEHVYGTQMLAIAMWSEFNYKLDLTKVLAMLAVHEMEEIKIGDLTFFEVTKQEKLDLGHSAIESILKILSKGDAIKKLIYEFDERKSPEARFAYFCDKLEADLQCKLYDEMKCVDLTDPSNEKARNIESVKKVLEEEKTWSGAWLKFSQKMYNYDENFLSVSEYAKDNKISF